MPITRGDERLQPSLLDRLTDTAPRQGPGRAGTDQQHTMTMQQLRQAVLRDLAWLLNTSNLATIQDLSETPLAARSTVNYGIPGFAGMVGTTVRAGSLEEQLADAIRAFEPRIRPGTLRVTARGALEDDAVPALVFVIEGELWAQPVPMQLFLETTIEVETRLAVVTDAARVGAGSGLR